MEIQIINESLLSALHEQAAANERKRQNHDLRTTPDDTSQRMLNVLEVGTEVPIHRHTDTSETVICLEGCLDEVFYEECPAAAAVASLSTAPSSPATPSFKEVARYRLCPREKRYGIQIPPMMWHTIEVHEPSVIFEAKDGAYGK